MKPLLIMKTGSTVPGVPRERGDFEHWIESGMGVSGRCRVVDVVKGEALPQPEELSGVVVTGSPAMVTDRESWSETAAQWLRQAVEKLPVLGICYGHQLLAHALGGRVDFHPRGREIGTTTVELTEEAARDPLFASLPAGSFPVHVSHKQTVTTLPPGAVVLARNTFEPFHAVRYRDKVWGLQFHPEFADDVMRAYLDDRRSALVEEGLDPEALRAQVRETPEATSLLRRFADLLSG